MVCRHKLVGIALNSHNVKVYNAFHLYFTRLKSH
jgi:hypothetical protein